MLQETTSQEMVSKVRHVVAEVTRYPMSILEAESSFEEELGIDSVKLGEIVATLNERYGVSLSPSDSRQEATSIAVLAKRLGQLLELPAPDTTAPATGASTSELQQQLRSIFQNVTRYPLEILTPEADLEEELGIDSVKLGEVLAVVRERYGLERIEVDGLATIGDLARALEHIETAAGGRAPAPPAAPPAAPPVASPATRPAPGAGSGEELVSELRQIMADVTRYPMDILTPEADLEEELGIDSVKLGEILAVVRERYSLEKIDVEGLATIGDLAAALGGLTTPAPAAPVSQAIQAREVSQTLQAPAPQAGAATRGADHELVSELRQIMADVTRYPLDVLTPEADLEEELGIDSVKLGEILAAVRERYGIERLDPEGLATIDDLANVLSRFVQAGEPPAPATAQSASPAEPAPRPEDAPQVQTQALSRDQLVTELQGIMADVTRYPVDILTAEANLEEELGIDSVKLGEILAAVRQQYGIADLKADGLANIGDVAEVLVRHLGGAARAPEPAPEPLSPARPPVRVEAVEPPPRRSLEAPVPAAPATSASIGSVAAAADLAGKVAFISGSGRGLGKVIAERLGRRGATVIVNSFHSRDQGEATTEELRVSGLEASHVWGSVTNTAHLDRMFAEIEAAHGGLDLFVSNATSGRLKPLEEITVEDWELAFKTDVVAYHQCAIRAARLMRANGGGSIVTMSATGSRRYLEYYGGKGAIKAAVEALTRDLAVELAPDRIRCNCICAGPIYGELLTRHYPHSATLIPRWEAATLSGTLCTPEEVADTVAFLLSDASRAINGQVIMVDHGVHRNAAFMTV